MIHFLYFEPLQQTFYFHFTDKDHIEVPLQHIHQDVCSTLQIPCNENKICSTFETIILFALSICIANYKKSNIYQITEEMFHQMNPIQPDNTIDPQDKLFMSILEEILLHKYIFHLDSIQ